MVTWNTWIPQWNHQWKLMEVDVLEYYAFCKKCTPYISLSFIRVQMEYYSLESVIGYWFTKNQSPFHPFLFMNTFFAHSWFFFVHAWVYLHDFAHVTWYKAPWGINSHIFWCDTCLKRMCCDMKISMLGIYSIFSFAFPWFLRYLCNSLSINFKRVYLLRRRKFLDSWPRYLKVFKKAKISKSL